jgi:hypothetical protein
VHAEAAWDGHRVNHPPKRRLPREDEVVALGEVLRRNGLLGQALKRAGHRLRPEPGGIHNQPKAHPGGLLAAQRELNPIVLDDA